MSNTVHVEMDEDKKRKLLEIDNQRRIAKSALKKRKLAAREVPFASDIALPVFQNNPKKKMRTGPKPAVSKETLIAPQAKQSDSLIPATVIRQSTTRVENKHGPLLAQSTGRKRTTPRHKRDEYSNVKIAAQPNKEDLSHASNVETDVGTLEGIPRGIYVSHKQIAENKIAVEDKDKRVKVRTKKIKAKKDKTIPDEVLQKKRAGKPEKERKEAAFQELQEENTSGNLKEQAPTIPPDFQPPMI